MRFIILGFAILLSSCATTTNNYYSSTIQTWQGASSQDLVAIWGQPDIKAVGPSGYTVYVYKTVGYRANYAATSPQIGVNFAEGGKPIIVSQPNLAPNTNRGMALLCTTLFTANPKGIIVESKAQGAGCYANTSFANKYGHQTPVTGR